MRRDALADPVWTVEWSNCVKVWQVKPAKRHPCNDRYDRMCWVSKRNRVRVLKDAREFVYSEGVWYRWGKYLPPENELILMAILDTGFGGKGTRGRPLVVSGRISGMTFWTEDANLVEGGLNPIAFAFYDALPPLPKAWVTAANAERRRKDLEDTSPGEEQSQ